MKDANRRLGLDRPGTYEIKVPGRLDEGWSEWFEGMTITVERGDDGPTITTLTGIVGDEAALRGLLDRLHSLGLRLLSVKRTGPGLEQDSISAGQVAGEPEETRLAFADRWGRPARKAGTRVESGLVQQSVRELSQCIPFRFPATGWYFSRKQPHGGITFDNGKWTCMFKLIERVATGEKLCFSARHTGCRCAAFYLGFEEPGAEEGAFLATQARVKMSVEFGVGHYAKIQALAVKEDHLVLERIESIEDGIPIEVVNLWVDALSLSGLVTLGNYDRGTNDNVVVPYASGCQSIWTIPYKEALQRSPRAVVGAIDPVVRHYLPADVISFSMPADRFIEMSRNAPESFLNLEPWTALLG